MWEVFDEAVSIDLVEQAQEDCRRGTRAWGRRQKMLKFWRATHNEQCSIKVQECDSENLSY